MGSDILLWCAILFGFYMAWNIGANDVANAMGTSVGSGALSFRRAVLLAAVFEFVGAVFVGAHVTNTVRKGIVDPSFFASDPRIFIHGMVAALLGAAIWLHLASYFGQPASTTHSIVGAIFGFGLIAGGSRAVGWSTLGKIVLSWVVSPLCGGLIACAMFIFLLKTVITNRSPSLAIRKIAPFMLFLVGFTLTLSMMWKGLKNMKLDFAFPQAMGIALVGGILVAIVGAGLLFRKPFQGEGRAQELGFVEGIFRHLQVVTACYVAFAHGANDVANAVGPLAAVASVMQSGEIRGKVEVPLWVLILGGLGIVSGLAMFGRKVMETIGSRITEMTPSRGFTAEFAAATTVLICSKMGMPISTTHTLVGSVIGVAMARGIGALDIRVVKNIAFTWLITIPAAGIFTLVTYGILRLVFS